MPCWTDTPMVPSCPACGECAEICPEVFEVVDDLASVIAEPVPEEFEEACQEAAGDCPVEAISIE